MAKIIVDSMDFADILELYIKDKECIVERKHKEYLPKLFKLVCKSLKRKPSYFKPIEFKESLSSAYF